jgi:hypothetical protein
MGDELE